MVTTAEAGQCVSLALKRVKRAEVRKGMVLVPKTDTPPRGRDVTFTWIQEADANSNCSCVAV
jgi:GTPase